MPIARQHPNFDTRLLKRVYCVGNAILQFILNRRCTEHNQFRLNDLGSLVQSFTPSIYSRRCLSVYLGPLSVFGLGYVSVREAECPQSLGRIVLLSGQLKNDASCDNAKAHLKMNHRFFDVYLRFCQPFQNNCVGTFAIEFNLTIRSSDDC